MFHDTTLSRHSAGTAEPDVLLSRKQEVSLEALEHSRALYLVLCKSNDRYRVIDASQPLNIIVENVLKEICLHD
jgi:hypothetical protein